MYLLQSIPTVGSTEPWDGKGGRELNEEDELSLDELMGSDDNEEL